MNLNSERNSWPKNKQLLRSTNDWIKPNKIDWTKWSKEKEHVTTQKWNFIQMILMIWRPLIYPPVKLRKEWLFYLSPTALELKAHFPASTVETLNWWKNTKRLPRRSMRSTHTSRPSTRGVICSWQKRKTLSMKNIVSPLNVAINFIMKTSLKQAAKTYKLMSQLPSRRTRKWKRKGKLRLPFYKKNWNSKMQNTMKSRVESNMLKRRLKPREELSNVKMHKLLKEWVLGKINRSKLK